MAKRRRAAAAVAPHPAPAPRPAPVPAAGADAFWDGFAISPAKLALVRFALFGVLAIDAFFQLSHAPRYGSGFNVGNLRFLDGLAPGRDAFAATELALTFLFASFALGAALRLVPLAALLYNWVYFSSQLDSYQHHYLVSLVLILACFAPWRAPDAATGPRRSWALRLVLVQLGVMYLWAAVAKLHGAWLDGTALSQQISTPWMRSMFERIGWGPAAIGVLAFELVLAGAIWNRRAWPVIVVPGIAFHMFIEHSGLEIGLFSYVMVALYLLILPEGWVTALGLDRAHAWLVARAPTPSRVTALVATAVAAIAVGVLLGLAPLVDGAVITLGVVATALGALTAPRRALPSAIAHVLAALLVFAMARGSTEVPEYYKFWAGSARRLGKLDDARRAYERLLEVKPDSAPAHYYLGTWALADHHDDDALAHWHAAQQIDASDPRAFVAEARWLIAQGRRDEARTVVAAALRGRPGDADALALQAQLGTAP